MQCEKSHSSFNSLFEPKTLPFEDSYHFLGVNILVRADSEEVLKFLMGSYPRFRSNNTVAENELRIIINHKAYPFAACIQAPKHQYLINKTTKGFVISCRNLVSGTCKTVRFNNGQIYLLSNSEMPLVTNDELSEKDKCHIFTFVQIVLLRAVATLMPHCHLLHAAAVVWGKKGIILPGATGRGKTMLSVALVKSGFNFLSDDVACLDLATNYILPFPRSLNMRRSGLDILNILLQPDSTNDIPTQWPMDIDKLFPNSLGQACPLSYVVLLKGDFRSVPELKPIPKRQALWQAVKLSHSPVTDPREALWRLSPLIDQARCYELIVGELSATADLLRRLTEGDSIG